VTRRGRASQRGERVRGRRVYCPSEVQDFALRVAVSARLRIVTGASDPGLQGRVRPRGLFQLGRSRAGCRPTRCLPWMLLKRSHGEVWSARPAMVARVWLQEARRPNLWSAADASVLRIGLAPVAPLPRALSSQDWGALGRQCGVGLKSPSVPRDRWFWGNNAGETGQAPEPPSGARTSRTKGLLDRVGGVVGRGERCRIVLSETQIQEPGRPVLREPGSGECSCCRME
jgi:hypothetical protein